MQCTTIPCFLPLSLATGLGVQHLGAHTILRQLMGFWLQVGIQGSGLLWFAWPTRNALHGGACVSCIATHS